MDEKEFQKNIHNETRTIKLTESERVHLRTNIMQFMEGVSASVRKEGVETSSLVAGKPRHLQGLNKHHMIIGAIIALFIGGSTAFAAEGAIPGDTLYLVKIHVNEEVRDWMEISASAQATWEEKKALRRIEEAKELKAKGQLSAEVRTELGAQISANAHAVSEEAKKLHGEGKREEATQIHTEFSNFVHTEAQALGITVSGGAQVNEDTGSTTTTSDTEHETEIHLESTDSINVDTSGESNINVKGELKSGIGL